MHMKPVPSAILAARTNYTKMKDSIKTILDLLQTRKARKTDGARITIQQAEDVTRYTDIFIWKSDVPDNAHFSTDVVVESGITISAVIEALKSTRNSCVVASFSSTGPNCNIELPQSLTELVEGASHVQLHDFWTSNLSWKFFHRLFPVRAPQVWQSLTSITLDISVNTLEDQASCMNVLLRGDLRNFLSELRLLQQLSLSFHSELLGHEVLCSHAPFEHVVETQNPWLNLKSLHLDGFDSTAKELILFLGSHRATLKSLTLRNYFLLSSSWMQLLPDLRELLKLEKAEISGAVEGSDELWLVKTPGCQKNCLLSEWLTYWLTHSKANLSCPLTTRNLVWKTDPQEEDWK